MKNTSNIARANTTKTTAMPALNQGDALMAPKARDVRMTMTPSPP